MNYSKLQNAIADKSSIAEFCSIVGMSESGYYKMIKAESMKIETLEKFSHQLGIDMCYWWTDEKDNSSNFRIGDNAINTIIELLKSQINDKDKVISVLEKLVRKYENENSLTE